MHQSLGLGEFQTKWANFGTDLPCILDDDNKGVPPRATVEVLADAEVVWLKSYNRGAKCSGRQSFSSE